MGTGTSERRVVPVAVELRGPLRAGVLRVVEGALGWPVVGVDDLVLPPALVLVDAATPAAVRGRGRLVVLVVEEGDAAGAVARAARGADAVVEGVPDAEELRSLVRRARPAARHAVTVTVRGAAGGVGCTTVATALAGVRAWRSGPVLLVTTGPAHLDGVPLVAAGDVASPAAWTAARPATAVSGLRVLAVRPGTAGEVVAGDVPLVVDAGADDGVGRAEVLVVRPDRAGLAACERVAADAVALVGRGPVPPSTFRAAVGDAALVPLPWSARVAAAAAAQRSPADLPGTWIRTVASLLPDVVPAGAVPGGRLPGSGVPGVVAAAPTGAAPTGAAPGPGSSGPEVGAGPGGPLGSALPSRHLATGPA